MCWSAITWKHFSAIGRSSAIPRFSDSSDPAIVSDHMETTLAFVQIQAILLLGKYYARAKYGKQDALWNIRLSSDSIPQSNCSGHGLVLASPRAFSFS